LNEKLLFSRTKRIIERTSVVGIDGFGLLSNACLHASKPSFLGTLGYKPFTSMQNKIESPGSFCSIEFNLFIINTEDYVHKIENELQDSSTYKQVEKDLTEEITKRVFVHLWIAFYRALVNISLEHVPFNVICDVKKNSSICSLFFQPFS
jgi:hypothetical protein